MEKLNIAKLLKDCPKGMELDCTMYDNCTFDGLEDVGLVSILVKTPSERIKLTKNGCYIWGDKYAKCVIFPKGKTTWEGFQIPFKDGDIVATENGLWIGITKGGEAGRFIPTYCVVKRDGTFEAYFDREEKWSFNRLATEKEKQKLFDTIKANGYHWNAETKTLEKLVEPKFKVGDVLCDDKRVYRIYDIDDTHYKSIYIQDGNSLCSFFPIHTQDRYMSVNCCFWVGDRITDGNKFIYLIKEVTQTGYILKDLKNTQITFEEARLNFVKVEGKFDITTLKPFDKVLVAYPKGGWHIQFFEKYSPTSKFPFICIGGSVYQKCVPYEENKHLMDTTNDCDEYYKTWE